MYFVSTVFSMFAFAMGLSFYTCTAGSSPLTALFFLVGRPECKLIESRALKVFGLSSSWLLSPPSDLIRETPVRPVVVDVAF